VVVDGAMVDIKGDGMFVHAIQGMRPDAVSSFRSYYWGVVSWADDSLPRGGTLLSSPPEEVKMKVN